MGEKIALNATTREVARAVAKPSIVKCTKTSAPDVYVNAITKDETTTLHAGDSAAIDKVLTLRLHIFRTSQENPFTGTAELELSEV
jgi:hypothetical protein